MKKELKNCLDIFFSGDIDEFNDIWISLYNDPPIKDGGMIFSSLLKEYKFNKKYKMLFTSILRGDCVREHDVELSLLVRSGICLPDGRLSNYGRLVAISNLSFHEQALFMDVQVNNLDVSKFSGTNIESQVATYLRDKNELVIEREWLFVINLINAVQYATHEHMLDCDINNNVRDYLYRAAVEESRSGWYISHIRELVSSYLISNRVSFYLNQFGVDSEELLGISDSMRKLCSSTIGNMRKDKLLELLSVLYEDGMVNWHNGIDEFLSMIDLMESLIGMDSISFIISAMIENEISHFGWPDITCINRGEINLIEVKSRRDKFRINQLELVDNVRGFMMPPIKNIYAIRTTT